MQLLYGRGWDTMRNRCKCLWKNSSKVQHIEFYKNDICTLNKYINKENNYSNKSIPIKVNDYA